MCESAHCLCSPVGDKDLRWLWRPVVPAVYPGDGSQRASMPGSLAAGEELPTGELAGGGGPVSRAGP